MAQTAGNPADEGVAETEDTRGYGAGIHQLAREKEERDGKKREVIGRERKLRGDHVQRNIAEAAGYDEHEQGNKADRIRRAVAQKEQQHKTYKKNSNDHASSSFFSPVRSAWKYLTM